MSCMQKMVGGIFTLTLMAALLSGCATTGESTHYKPPQPSGFLSSYESLKPMEGSDSAKSWRRADMDWKKYNKVLINRMQVYLKEDSEHKGVDPTDLKMLLDYFYDVLVKQISTTAAVVEQPGPDVIGMKIAIVNLVPTKYAMSIAGTLTPYAFVAEASSGPASGRPAGSTPYLGETGIEIQFVDSVSGEVLGEFSDNQIGKKYDVDTSKGVSDATQKWVTGYMDSFTTWSYAKRSFDRWAELLRERFDELRGVQAAK